MFTRLATVAGLVALLCCTSLLAAEIEPTAMWAGKNRETELRKLAPSTGFIGDADTFKKIWTAWRPDEDVPEIDFAKHLVLVGVVPGPNQVLMRPSIEDGDVRFRVAGTKIGGPGFGYRLLQISRDGVKSVNGHPVGVMPEAEPMKGAEDSITVKVVGTLKHGIFAVGGETTGTIITSGGVTWELDLGKNADFQKAAETLDGQKVLVTGQLERREGVEIPQRWIVQIDSLKAAE